MRTSAASWPGCGSTISTVGGGERDIDDGRGALRRTAGSVHDGAQTGADAGQAPRPTQASTWHSPSSRSRRREGIKSNMVTGFSPGTPRGPPRGLRGRPRGLFIGHVVDGVSSRSRGLATGGRDALAVADERTARTPRVPPVGRFATYCCGSPVQKGWVATAHSWRADRFEPLSSGDVRARDGWYVGRGPPVPSPHEVRGHSAWRGGPAPLGRCSSRAQPGRGGRHGDGRGPRPAQAGQRRCVRQRCSSVRASRGSAHDGVRQAGQVRAGDQIDQDRERGRGLVGAVPSPSGRPARAHPGRSPARRARPCPRPGNGRTVVSTRWGQATSRARDRAAATAASRRSSRASSRRRHVESTRPTPNSAR